MLLLGWWIGTKTVKAEQKRIKPVIELPGEEGKTSNDLLPMKQNPQTLVLLAIGTLLIGFIGFRAFQSNRVYDDYGKKNIYWRL